MDSDSGDKDADDDDDLARMLFRCREEAGHDA